MTINWKLRLQNKVTLTALLLGIVALVYQMLNVFGVAPLVAESEVVNVIAMVIDILVLLGVVVDPTTHGASDSEQAMHYSQPK